MKATIDVPLQDVPTRILPSNPQRKGEGGLRYQASIKLTNNDKVVKTQPLVTVITVVFNGANTLEQTILSVINQSYKNVEFIIIDGGSTDGTLDIIRKYEHAIDYWVSEPDAGIYDAFNKAVTCASGDWVCFIGADDYLWDSDVLTNMAPSLLQAIPKYKLVYGRVAIVSTKQQLIYCVGEPWEIAKSKSSFTMPIPHQALMYHRSWFEQYGLFDTSYQISGDYENLLRGLQGENALFNSDCILTAMAQGGVSSSSESSIKLLKEMWRAQRAHGALLLPSFQFLLVFMRVYIRLFLQSFLGERNTYHLLDLGRRLCRKPNYWTKL